MTPRIGFLQWIGCNLLNIHKFESWHYRNVRSDAPLATDTKVPIKSATQVKTRTCSFCGRVEMRRL